MSENDAAFRYGNFEVLARADGAPDLLGGGSFGKTYKARHVFLDQIIALKVISDKFAHDKNAKERFLREARVVHGLRHPNIAQIIDFGEANATLYYAMEYCEGGTLEDLVKRTGPLDPGTVLLLAQQLAEALECSHRHGFIHRDVKPANVMLADKGEALVLKLVDFGLVKPLVQDNERMASLTLDGQNFFTPLFASPEQVMEEELDARSDLFSLGMTLWYLLKGAAPESGSTAVIMSKRLSADSYHAQLPTVLPPKLSYILQKLLEKDKANRFSSATEALQAMLSDDPAPVVQPPETQPPITAPPETDGPDPGETLAFEAPPAPVRLADKYKIAEKLGRSALGNIYRAVKAEDGVPLSLTVLDDALRENDERMGKLREAVAQVVRAPHESISQVYGLEEFADAEVLVREWNGGVSLQSVVKSRGSIPFAEALLPLRVIAAGVDFAASNALSGVRLAPDEIYLQPADGSLEFPESAALLTTHLRQWPPFRIRLTPILLEDEAAQDISMTLSAQSIGSPRVEFGSLLYRLVAGMQVKFAARVNRASYIRTAGLSEEGNWILSGCIVDEVASNEGCGGVLQALQRAEGVNDNDTGTATTMRQPGSTTRSSVKTGGANPTRSGQSGGATQTKPAKPPASTQSARPLPPATSTQSRKPLPPPHSTQSPKPLPPPPAVATQSTKLKTTAARLPEPVAAPPPRPPTPPVPSHVDAPPPVPVPAAPPPLAEYRGEQAPPKPLPLVPILVGIAVAVAVLGTVAFLLLRSKPSDDEHGRVTQQTPVPTATAVQTPTPRLTPTATPTATQLAVQTPRRNTPTPATPTPATPTPVPPTFVLRNGSQLTTASFELGGRAVTPATRGSDLVFPLDGLGSTPGDLTVKLPGYKPTVLTLSVNGSADAPANPERETAPVYVAFKSRDSDYSYLSFTFTGPLPGERVPTPTGHAYSLKSVSSSTPLPLPTGKYDYTLYGATLQDDHIAPIKGSITVTTQTRAEVPVPPSFVGSYKAEFDADKQSVHVVRTIVINAGLTGGHVDETEYKNRVPTGPTVPNIPLAEMHVDARGVLIAHIQYAALKIWTYDEVIELQRNAAGDLVMSGGRDAMPNDAGLRAAITEKVKRPLETNRPGQIVLRTTE